MKSKRFFLTLLVLFGICTVLFFSSDAMAFNSSKGNGRVAYDWGKKFATGISYDGCWFCSLFKTIFCIGNNIAVTVYDTLASACLKLTATLIALWFVLMGLKLILGFSMGGPEFLTNFFKAMLSLFVATVLLVPKSTTIFSYFINPLLEGAATLSSDLMTTANATTDASGNKVKKTGADLLSEWAGVRVSNLNGNIYCIKNTTTGEEAPGFSGEAIRGFLNMLREANLQAVLVMILGGALMSAGFANSTLGIPDVFFLAPGVLLLWFVFKLLITYVGKLIDTLVRMLFVCSLLPLYVMFWVFPITRGYTATAVKIFITCLFMFVCLSVLMTLALALLSEGGNTIKVGKEPTLKLVLKDLNNGSYDMTIANYSMWSPGFLLMMATAIIATKLLDLAEPLAGSFGGASMGGGPGAAVAAGAQRLAGGATSLAGRGAAKLGKGAALGAWQGGKWGFGKLKQMRSASAGAKDFEKEKAAEKA